MCKGKFLSILPNKKCMTFIFKEKQKLEEGEGDWGGQMKASVKRQIYKSCPSVSLPHPCYLNNLAFHHKFV